MTSTTRPPEADVSDPRFKGHPSHVWCFVLFLVANMFAGHTDGLGLPVGPDRILLAGAVVLLLIDPRYSLGTLRLRTVHAFGAATLVWALLSAVSVGTLQTTFGFFALLDRLAVPFLLFTVAPVVFRRQQDRVLLLKTMTCIGFYLGVTAILEQVGPTALVFPRYIMDPAVGIGFGRSRGPFTSSEADGLVMLMAVYCALALVRLVEGRLWITLARLVVPLCLLGSVLTLTRSIWLGMVLGLIAVAVLDRRLRRGMVAIALVVAIATAVIAAALPSLAERAVDRGGDETSLYDRRNFNAAAVRAALEHPVTGIGWAHFYDVSANYVRQADTYPIKTSQLEVHNVVLARAAELGVPGATLWVVTVALGLGGAVVRPLSRAPDRVVWQMVAVGSLIAWLVPVALSPLSYPLPNNLVWLFAGIASGSFYLRVGAKDEENVV